MLRIVQWQIKVCNTIAVYSRVRVTKMKVFGQSIFDAAENDMETNQSGQ